MKRKTKRLNSYEKMAKNGIAFRSQKFSKVGLTGKHSKIYNSETCRDFVDRSLDACGLDVDVINEGFGKKNILIKRGSVKGKNNRYNEKDVIGRFSDCDKLTAFVSGYEKAYIKFKRK